MKARSLALLVLSSFCISVSANSLRRVDAIAAHGFKQPADIQSVDSVSNISDPVLVDTQADGRTVTEIPGEHIDSRTGELLLTATDLVVPGPGGMDLIVSRTRRTTFYASLQETLNQDHTFQEQLADWRLDVPYVQTATPGLFNSVDGTVFLYTADSTNVDGSARGVCPYPEAPYWQLGNVNESPLLANQYWFKGTRILGIPGVPSQELLHLAYADNIAYAGPDNWRGFCAAGQYNSASQTKFIISSPDGRTYVFDEPTFGNTAFTGQNPYGYMRTFISQITDRNGNWIKYEYDNCIPDANNTCQVYAADQQPSNYVLRDYAYVKRITTSDGREVDFKWEPNPFCGVLGGCSGVHTGGDGLNGIAADGAPLFRLASFTYGTRTWQFKYSDSLTGADKSRYLSQVILPNGQSWSYTASAGYNGQEPSVVNCGYPYQMIDYTVGFPDGATVNYAMQPHWFYRNNFSGNSSTVSCWPLSAVKTRSVIDGAGATSDAPANTRWCYSAVYPSLSDAQWETLTHVLSPTRYEVYSFFREFDPNNNPNKSALEGRITSAEVRPAHPAGIDPAGFDICPTQLDPKTGFNRDVGFLRQTLYDYSQDGAYTSNGGFPFTDPNVVSSDIEVYPPSMWRATPVTLKTTTQPDIGGTATYITKSSSFVDNWYPQYTDETVLGGNVTDTSTRRWLTTYAYSPHSGTSDVSGQVYGLPQKHCLIPAGSTVTDCPTDSTGTIVQGTASIYADSHGNLLSQSSYGKTKSFTYYATGDTWTSTDERQSKTTFSSYKNGIPQTIQLPGADGATIYQVVNDSGTIKSIKNARGNTTGYDYDERNRLKTVTPPIGAGTAITWAADGQNQQKTIATGSSQTVNHYDGFGRLIETDATDTSRNETIVKTYKHDSVGRLTFESYPNDTNGLQYEYDALDRRWKTTRTVDSKTTQITFSSPETQTTKDFNGHSTTSKFVSYGAPSLEQLQSASIPYTGKDSNGNSTSGTALTSYQRDLLGFANSVSQGSVTRSYQLDAKRQLVMEYLPEIGTTPNSAGFNVGYCRDDAGNLLNKWIGIPNGFSCSAPPAGPLFTNSYDARNRLTNVGFADPATPDVSIPSYTTTDKVKTIIKGSVEIDMDYDAAENLQYEVFKIDGYAFRMYYTYDSLNHLSSIQYPSGKTLQLSPDAFGRTRGITGILSEVDYYPTGLPETITYTNGEVTSITPTPQNYVDTIVTLGQNNTAVSLNYEYDDNGNVKQVVDGLRSGDGMLLTYDELNRQISTQYTPGGVAGTTYRRGYDATGNVMFDQTPERALTMAYTDGYNRLNSISGSVSRTLHYDGLGNMSNDGVRALTFDKAGNLQSSQNPVTKQFVYDGRNRVISETTAQGTKYYVYSGEKLMFEYSPYAQTYTEYVYLKRQLVGTRVVTNVAQTDIDKFQGRNWSPP